MSLTLRDSLITFLCVFLEIFFVRVGWVLNVLRGGGLMVNLVGDLHPIFDFTLYVFILNQ